MRKPTTAVGYVVSRSGLMPAEIRVEPARLQQRANAGDPLEPPAGEVAGAQAVLLKRRIQLFDALAHRPTQLDSWQSGQLAAVDAVATHVRTGALGEADLAARHYLADQLGDLADAIVVLGAANVEGLVVDKIARRVEQ